MFNPDFYPTPEALAHRMFDKVDFSTVKKILEPSAGKGDLIKALETHYYTSEFSSTRGKFKTWDKSFEIDAIEIEQDLQAVLNSMDQVSVIDSDFLSYAGGTHYDLVIANFPFSDGDKHLHKAIDLLFCGQIVCLLNAETLKNPCTKSRQDLVAKLQKLGAEIEFIEDAFASAERKTKVEVALIYINIKRSVEIDVFGEMKDETAQQLELGQEEYEISNRETYPELVAKFNQTCEQVNTQLISFYKHYKNVSEYLDLQIKGEKDDRNEHTLTDLMRKKYNQFLKKIKQEYWEKVTELPEVRKYLTSTEVEKLAANTAMFHCKEFTVSNIQQFILNLVKTYPEHINQAILDLFEMMTRHALKDQSWHYEEYKKSIHYFNAWKTNSGYKINKKVIMPFYQDYYGQKWCRIGYSQAKMLRDIETVMRYFKPSSFNNPIDKACEEALKNDQNRKIETDYFFISIFKKGTLHLEFKDDDLLRRFNIEACKMKNFIPKEYSDKDYTDLSSEEKDIVNQFEGAGTYTPIKDNIRLTGSQNILALEHKLSA